MVEQIKRTLWKLLFASAIFAAFSGLTILADARQIPQPSEITVVEEDEKPTVRCPLKWIVKQSQQKVGCANPKPPVTVAKTKPPKN